MLDLEDFWTIVIYAGLCLFGIVACLLDTPSFLESRLDLYILMQGVSNLLVIAYKNETTRFQRNDLVELLVLQYLCFVLVHQMGSVSTMFELDDLLAWSYCSSLWKHRTYHVIFLALWIVNMMGSFCLLVGGILYYCEIYIPKIGSWCKGYSMRRQVREWLKCKVDGQEAYRWLMNNLLNLEEALSHEAFAGLIYKVHQKAFLRRSATISAICCGCKEAIKQTRQVFLVKESVMWHPDCLRTVLQQDKNAWSPKWIEHIRVDSRYEEKLGYFNLSNDRMRRLMAKEAGLLMN